MEYKKLYLVCAFALILISCKNYEKKKSSTEAMFKDTLKPTVIKDKITEDTINYNSKTTNEITSIKLKNFITKKYLKDEDFKVLKPQDRKFSFYEIDLNSDDKPEYFIKFESNYFRGTGGGSFLLLSNDLKIINNFTVTNEPIFRSYTKTNGWNDLILFGDTDEKSGIKNYVHLKFNKKKEKYPSNPSKIDKIEIAPSGHDFAMWHSEFSKAKIFNF